MTALLQKGFRPFFIGAAFSAIVSMAAWLGVYNFGLEFQFSGVTPLQWHAHEMLYGYALAVIAGFLLTAAASWTGQETLSGARLGALFSIWVVARLLMLPSVQWMAWAGLADSVFLLILGLAIALPVLRVRQTRQWPVLVLLCLFIIGNGLFYLGALTAKLQWVNWSIYGGFYAIIGMVLFMGSRVIPFFTGRGVGYPFEPKKQRWNDIATALTYPLFALCEVVPAVPAAPSWLAGLLGLLLVQRLTGWYTPGIWSRPLLWSLHLSFALIATGFLLHAINPVLGWSELLVLHVFALGGLGLVTLSMMSRVAQGHTGRNVHQPPALVRWFLICLLLALAVRVPLAALVPDYYTVWITLSGLLWIASFALFAFTFVPLLTQPRPDAANG